MAVGEAESEVPDVGAAVDWIGDGVAVGDPIMPARPQPERTIFKMIKIAIERTFFALIIDIYPHSKMSYSVNLLYPVNRTKIMS